MVLILYSLLGTVFLITMIYKKAFEGACSCDVARHSRREVKSY